MKYMSKYGRLSIVSEGARSKRGRKTFILLCKCGAQITREQEQVFRGGIKSCGCLKKDKQKLFGKSMKKYTLKHGLEGTRFYRTYRGIIHRTKHPSCQQYKWYGGKGIKCLWDSFEEFKKDMYKSYLEHSRQFGEKNTFIERKDNEKDYSAENCIWATSTVQARNRSNNLYISYKGETLIVADWARKIGCNNQTLWERVRKKWPLERVVSVPIRKKN